MLQICTLGWLLFDSYPLSRSVERDQSELDSIHKDFMYPSEILELPELVQREHPFKLPQYHSCEFGTSSIILSLIFFLKGLNPFYTQRQSPPTIMSPNLPSSTRTLTSKLRPRLCFGRSKERCPRVLFRSARPWSNRRKYHLLSSQTRKHFLKVFSRLRQPVTLWKWVKMEAFIIPEPFPHS